MPRIVRSEAVIPGELSASERSRLADELLEVYQEIYESADREYVLKTVVEANADHTTVLLHKNAEGKIVGYFAIMFYERQFRGVPTTVIRSSVGTRRAYRGNNSNIGWALRVLMQYRLSHPGRPIYGLGAMAHPSSYLQVVRYVNEYWPRPDEAVPPDVLAFMLDIADEFEMRTVDPERPLVRYAWLTTRESDVEREYWLQSDKPAVKFFVSANPTYSKGNGLLTLFPISPSMLAHLTFRIARDRARKTFDGAIASAQRTPAGSRLLRPTRVRRLLAEAPVFSRLDRTSLDALVARAEPISHPAGTYLFKEGDAGDDVYLVARGAVYVTGASSDDAMIDQLGTGSLVGVIGALSGERRTASVRTAIPTTLVRFPGDAVRALMASSDVARQSIWSMFTARVFDLHVRESGRFPALDRNARKAWVAQARHVDIAAGASVDARGAAYLVVLTGAVRPERDATDAAASQPKVIEIDPSAPLVARTAARVALVPPAASA